MDNVIITNSINSNENKYFLDFVENLPTKSKEFTEEYEEIAKYGYVIDNVMVDINSNLWDLSSLCVPPRARSGYIYKFPNLQNELLYLEKLFIINQLNIRGPHATVIREYNKEINLFIEYINSLNIQSCEKIELVHIKAAIDNRLNTVSYRAISKLKLPIKLYLKYISLIYKDIYTIDIENYLESIDTVKVDRIANNNKTKILPTWFVNKFNNLIKVELDTLLNSTFDYNDEIQYYNFMLYSSIYILIQTGIRISELHLIPIYPIETVKLLNEEKKIYYFHYNSTKNQRKKIRAIASPTHKEFSEYIEKINNKIHNIAPLDLRKKYLFETHDLKNDEIRETIANFCIDHAEELGIIDTNEKWRFSRNKKVDINYKTVNISIPSPRQFRKYWACDMKKRGYSDIEIMRWLGHTDEKMLGYYGESEEIVADNINFSKKTLKNILENKDNILGPRGKQYQKDISEIAKENSYKSIDEIIDQILSVKQIRRKSGGFCCKANIGRPCKYDSDTDRFYCAYEMCPNQCHMYYDLVFYLKEFETLKLTYETNKKNNQTNAAEKELYKIKNLIRAKLLPELDELDNKIQFLDESQKTIDVIINEHPDMLDVIKNKENIRKELNLWIKK